MWAVNMFYLSFLLPYSSFQIRSLFYVLPFISQLNIQAKATIFPLLLDSLL